MSDKFRRSSTNGKDSIEEENFGSQFCIEVTNESKHSQAIKIFI